MFYNKTRQVDIDTDEIDDFYTNLKRENDDIVDKLHSMNKARYELETRISDECDKNKSLREIVGIKDETISRRAIEMDTMDKLMIEKDRELEGKEIERNGMEKSFDMDKKTFNTKIANLNDLIEEE